MKAVVTIGAPFDPEHVTHNFGDALETIARDGVAEVDLGGRPFRIRRDFIEDVAAEKLGEAIGKLNRALLVLHAPRDSVVGIDNATRIFMAAKHPKSFVTLDDADHLISRGRDAEYAAEVIAAWVGRYVPLNAPAPPHRRARGRDPGGGGRSERVSAGYLERARSSPSGGRAACLWRHQPGSLALRVSGLGAGGLHLDDDPDVCAAQGLAPDRYPGGCDP